MIAPFLKWAGGKRHLVPEILARLPERITRYAEPFLGGGAVFLALAQSGRLVDGAQVSLTDVNEELITTWAAVRDFPADVGEFLATLKTDEETYYEVRARQFAPGALPVQTAARMIYLNKTCFNGLYRVNSKGGFNAPWGKRTNVNFPTVDHLCSVSALLNRYDLYLAPEDFASAADDSARWVVYCDPPYWPVNETSFTKYTGGGFGVHDHVRLARELKLVRAVGGYGMVSNSFTPDVERMYQIAGLHVEYVQAPRRINRDGAGRGMVNEILATTAATPPKEV